MDEVKKTLLVGESGNTATVTEEDRNTRSLDAQYAQKLVKDAGRLLSPIGLTQLGFAVVHYYKKPIDGGEEPVFSVVCQTDISTVPEGLADMGWKQLQSALMKSYGRKDPKRRDS